MADPYYTFYPGDYQRDTQDLSLAEHGAYRLLLDHYYCEGKLPDDLRRIFRICKAKNNTERKAVQFVLETFFGLSENTQLGTLINLRNKRADREIKKRDKYRESQREKAFKKWEKENAGADTPADAGGVPGVCKPSPSPSPLKEKKNIKEYSQVAIDLFYKIEKYWPDVWKFIQRSINNDCFLEDILKTLESFDWNHTSIDEPWAWCNAVIEQKNTRRKETLRDEEWNKLKQEESSFAMEIADLLKSIGKKL